jgi:hypothetical protein
MKNINIKVEMNFTIDLNEIKNSLDNQQQILNNEIIFEYIKNNILDEALNSAKFIDEETSKNGNKGFLNQKLEEFHNNTSN